MLNPVFTTEARTPITLATSRWIDGLYQSRRTVQVRAGLVSVETAIFHQVSAQPTFASRVSDRLKERQRIARVADGLGYEIFARLYDPDSIETLARPAPDTEWVSLAHAAMDTLPPFAGTVGDPDMSAFATAKILSALAPAVKALIEQIQNGETDDSVSGIDQARAALRYHQAKINEAIASTKAHLNSLQPGYGEAPSSHEQEDNSRLILAEQLLNDPRISKCLELVGALRRHAEASRTKIDPRGRSQIYGLEQGNDLGRVLPQELAGLHHAGLRTLTLARYAERTLQQYRLEGVEKQGRGPMVVMVDESGSMRGDCHRYAMAIAIACVGLAVREDRSCTIISFNGGVRWVYRVDTNGAAFEHDRRKPDCFTAMKGGAAKVALALATSQPAGGTDFDAPVSYAMALNDGIMNNRADLILVTDGYATVSDDLLNRLDEAKNNEMRLYGFTVGGGSLSRAINAMCDTALDIDNATNEEIGRALA